MKKYLITLSLAVLLISCSINNDEQNNSNKKTSSQQSELDKKYPTGCLKEDPKILEKFKNYKLMKSSGNLPVYIDLQEKLPDPGYQSGNSCVGWAVAYYLKTFQEGLEMSWNIKNDESHIFSPMWVYNQINNGYDNGSSISQALQLIVEKGCDSIHGFPLTSNYTIRPDEDSMNRAENFKASSWQFLDGDVNTLKSILASGQVIVFRTEILPDFDNINFSNPVFDNVEGNSRGGHALCMIGYDDAKRAFKFINSWGAGWGLSGYGWISYDIINRHETGFIAFSLTDGPNTSTTKYTINAAAGTNGSIYPYGYTTVNPGENYTFTIISDTNYTIDYVIIDSINHGAISSYTFNNIQSNHTIKAFFKEITQITGNIKTQYRCIINQNIINQLVFELKIINTGILNMDLSNVKLRYYYSKDTNKDQNISIYWAQTALSNITVKSVSMPDPKPNADTYIEIGFINSSGILAPGNEMIINIGINNIDWSEYTQSNDYSFDSALTSFADWLKTPAYLSGIISYGMEP